MKEFNEAEYINWYNGFSKPWSDEVLTRFYIFYPGKIPSFVKLGEITGLAASTLRDLAKKYNWQDQRENYLKTLESSIIETTREKTVKLISDDLSALQADHYFSYQKIRKLIDTKFELQSEKIEDLITDYRQGLITRDRVLRELNKLRASDINFLSLAQDRSIQGERQAKGLQYYSDLDAAYKALQEDFVILPKTEYQQMLEDDQSAR